MIRLDRKATGRNIRRLISERGLTAREVSDALGNTSSNTVLNWSNGKFAPNLESVVQLASFLDVEVTDIIATTGKKSFKEPTATKVKKEVSAEDLEILSGVIGRLRGDAEELAVVLRDIVE